MATEATTPSAISTIDPSKEVGFQPIDWWADRDSDIGPVIESGTESTSGSGVDSAVADVAAPRRTPPIPAFVRLSRLIDPDRASTRHQSVVVTGDEHTPLEEPTEDGNQAPTASTRGWADSAGRPLFQIGLAAIVAAVIVAVATFSRHDEGVAAVNTSDDTTVVGPAAGRGAQADDEQARQVLEALALQTGGDGEADLSIVGTASAGTTEVRWTATIRNVGPGTAEGPITVVHTIGSDFELSSVAGTGWACEHQRAAGTITCELDEVLATGERRRLGLVTTIGADAGRSIASTMSVVAATPDPDLDNNSINVTAGNPPAEDGDEDNRSRSAGAAGQVGPDTNTSAGGAAVTNGPTTDGAGMDELPRTGSGLAAVLAAIGLGLCLGGRRLMRWSARAQTRSLLVAADIG